MEIRVNIPFPLGHYFLASPVLPRYPVFLLHWMDEYCWNMKKKYNTPHTILNMKSVDICIEKIGLTNFSSLS